jgi:hypothetical protein
LRISGNSRASAKTFLALRNVYNPDFLALNPGTLRTQADGKARRAIESPNASPEKDQSGKSEGVTGHALLALRIPDSTGRTASN